MYISHPFYSCFCSLSGPFRNYACRSRLLKLVLINCILWKVLNAHRKCIRFLPFLSILKSIRYVLTPWRGHWFFLQANVCFSCKKTSWRNGISVHQCNVFQYSFFLHFVFRKETCLTFLPFLLYIFLLEWSCRANKAALFFTYSHFNLLFKNSLFHLSHLTACPSK